MNLKAHPTDIAATILNRSVCAVQVAAVLVDNWGVFATGWNSSGISGLGEHAEAHCFRRANRERATGATLYSAARRKRNGRIVTAKPCEACYRLIRKRGIHAYYRDGDGMWRLV